MFVNLEEQGLLLRWPALRCKKNFLALCVKAGEELGYSNGALDDQEVCSLRLFRGALNFDNLHDSLPCPFLSASLESQEESVSFIRGKRRLRVRDCNSVVDVCLRWRIGARINGGCRSTKFVGMGATAVQAV